MKRVFVSIAVGIACAIACDDSPTSHQFLALQYDATNGCYKDSTALDTVPGGDGSLECAPACLVAGSGASEIVYVTTMCGPYPAAITDTSGTDPACAAALAAYSGGCSCDPQDDGGLACPPSAGGDDDAGDDSSGDNGGDDSSTGDDSSGDDSSGDDGGANDASGD
jgi:hypothetical protein